VSLGDNSLSVKIKSLRWRGRGQEGEKAQTMYAHVNKRIKKKKIKSLK
jgi:hypothetical protein